MRKKQKLYNKAKASGSESSWKRFREAKQSVSRNLKAAKENYIRDVLGESIKKIPKVFWSYIKKLNKDNVGVSDFEINGEIVDDSRKKLKMLSKNFSSVFTKENLTNIPSISKQVNHKIGPLVLNPKKLTGPHQIPPWFVKEY